MNDPLFIQQRKQTLYYDTLKLLSYQSLMFGFCVQCIPMHPE